MGNVNETQVGGNHYKTKFQHWDFVGQCLAGRYLEGCATKYPSRWRKKGEGLKDLRKATHYIDKIIDQLVVMDYVPLGLTRHNVTQLNQDIARFCHANDLTAAESEIIKTIANWSCLADLLQAKALLFRLIEAEQEIENEIQAMRQDNP